MLSMLRLKCMAVVLSTTVLNKKQQFYSLPVFFSFIIFLSLQFCRAQRRRSKPINKPGIIFIQVN